MIPRVVIPFPLSPVRVHKRTLRSDLQLLWAWADRHAAGGWIVFLIGSALLAAIVGVRSDSLAAATIQQCVVR